MDNPEIQPDAGTGDEQPAGQDPASEEITETPTDDSADGDASGDDGHAQEQDAAGSKVPYDRFYKVNERKKALELENAELKARLSSSQPKREEAPAPLEARIKKILKPAPQGLSTLEQMEYYNLESLEAHAPEILDRWFEKKFGMKAEAAAATLTHTTQTTREQIINKFETAARSRGLDPKNPQLQDAVGVLMDSGKYASFDAALDTFKPTQQQARPVSKPINGKGAEIDAVDLAAASRVRAIPRSAQEAVKLASQGKRIEQLSVTEILRATQDSKP